MGRKFVPAVLCALLAWGCSNGGGGPADPVDPGPGPGPGQPPASQTGTIAGTVNDIMGAGVGGVTVSVSGPENRSVQTASAGTFQIVNLPTGSYSVTAAPPSGYVVALGASGQATASVTGGGTAEVAFLLATEADADVVVVRLSNLAFVPPTVTIPAGARIRWRSTEPILHDVTPDGHSAWDSTPLQTTGDVFEHTFSGAGSFAYYCSYHRAENMAGVINVTQ